MSTTLERPADTRAPEIDNTEIDYLSFANLRAQYLEKRAWEIEQPARGVLKFKKDGRPITDLTYYNAAQPVLDTRYDAAIGQPYFILGVRGERRDDETDSVIEHFGAASEFADEWEFIDDLEVPGLRGQDPFVTEIGRQLLVGVVEVEPVPDTNGPGTHLEWWTALQRGPDIRHMAPFARGPRGMKDIRPIQLSSGEVLTFTRPQHRGNEALGGHGQIGEVITSSLEDIQDPELLQNAELINTRFLEGKQWGGINYGLALTDGRVGVIGHIAEYDENHPGYVAGENEPKIYSPFSAIYNPQTRKLEDVQLLALADEFKNDDGSDIEPKTPLLKDVAYGTAITGADENGNVRLILGIGDAVTCYKTIPDPFGGLRP